MCLKKEYFKILKLKECGVVWFGNNKTCKVHDDDIIKLKIFDNCKPLLCSVRYVSKLRRNLMSIGMFDDLDYCTRVKCVVLKSDHMNKGSKNVGCIFYIVLMLLVIHH